MADVTDAYALYLDDAETSGRSDEDEAQEMLGQVDLWRWLQNDTESGAAVAISAA